jgi:hypothetical protein
LKYIMHDYPCRPIASCAVTWPIMSRFAPAYSFLLDFSTRE